MCPKGDDPYTTDQNDREISVDITTTASNPSAANSSIVLNGTIGIKLYGKTAFISLSSPSNSDCIAALENSPVIGTVLCTQTVLSSEKQRLTITFTSWPTLLDSADNNVYDNNGNPAITDFYCDSSLASTVLSTDHSIVLPGVVQCNFNDIVSTNIKGLLLFLLCNYCY